MNGLWPIHVRIQTHNHITYTPESLPIHIVMLRDDGNSGLLLRLTGADDDSFKGCCCGGNNDLALVTVDRPTKQIPQCKISHKLVLTC